jgi:hypothetical protein
MTKYKWNILTPAEEETIIQLVKEEIEAIDKISYPNFIGINRMLQDVQNRDKAILAKIGVSKSK